MNELVETQGRIDELGCKMAKFVTSPGMLSTTSLRVSAQAVSTGPQTNSSFAIHAQTNPSITVPPPPPISLLTAISADVNRSAHHLSLPLPSSPETHNHVCCTQRETTDFSQAPFPSPACLHPPRHLQPLLLLVCCRRGWEVPWRLRQTTRKIIEC